MPTNLRLTTAGVAAVLDGDNTGTAAVKITKLALGAGSGMGGADDDGLTALRDQRDIVAVAGSAEANGQLAFRAEITSAGAYAATEMGLFARIGAGGMEFLFAYWTDGGTVFINKPADLRTIVAVTLSLVNSAADVEVTVTPTISVSAVAALLDLSDTPASYVNAARRKVAVNAAGDGVEFVAGLLPSETTEVNTAIQNAIDALLGGAPGALDTLNELAAAIGDNANFAATVTSALNARPTTTAVTNAIAAALAGYATTAAVAALSKGVTGAVDGKSADYTVVAGDDGKTIEVDATDGAIAVSLPDLAAGADGFTVTVLKTDSSTNAVTIDGDGADTINGAATYALESQHEAVVLKWNGTAWRAIGGATGGFLRSFFGDASSHEVTAAGTTTFTWPWNTSRGLAILEGGSGSGGSATSNPGRGGNGGTSTVAPTAGTSRAGSGGDATTVEANGTTYSARGGGGGGSAFTDASPEDFDTGNRGGAMPADVNPTRTRRPGETAHVIGGSPSRYIGGRGAGGDGPAGGDGATGIVNGVATRQGGRGGAGERVVVLLTGLMKGHTLSLKVGDGGAAPTGVTRPGGAGSAGSIRIYPLF